MHCEAAITLHVKPYIRRFVAAKLADRNAAAHDATARHLWIELERLLGLKVIGVLDDHLGPDAVVWRITLRVSHGPLAKLDPVQSRRYRVNAALNKAFYADMYESIVYDRMVLGLSIRSALRRHRDHYGVTEEDHPFLSAERSYHKRTLREQRAKKTTCP